MPQSSTKYPLSEVLFFVKTFNLNANIWRKNGNGKKNERIKKWNQQIIKLYEMNFVLRIASNFNFILFSFQYLLHCERRNKNYQDYSANVFVFWTRVEKPCFIVGFVFPSLSQVFSIWLHPNELCMLSKVLISPFFISFHADFSFMHFHEREKKTPKFTFVTSMYFLRCWCFARFKWRF